MKIIIMSNHEFTFLRWPNTSFSQIGFPGKNVLCMLASSVPCDIQFSSACHFINKKRCSL